MSILSKLFGRARGNAPAGALKEPENNEKGIAYDATLVPKMMSDHVEIFRIYGELKTCAGRNDFAALSSLLNEFKLALQTHVMFENVKFYVYLQKHLASDAELYSFITEVRKEMDGIARAVVKFANTYANGALTGERHAAFQSELERIGGVLTKRIGLEESRLYTLYLPAY